MLRLMREHHLLSPYRRPQAIPTLHISLGSRHLNGSKFQHLQIIFTMLPFTAWIFFVGKLSGPFEGVALEKLSSTEVVSNVVQTMAQRASLFGRNRFLGELRARNQPSWVSYLLKFCVIAGLLSGAARTVKK
jgi:hypothetical protein